MNLRIPAVSAGSGEGRPITGRTVLVLLLAFFGLVTLVNVFMIRAAISTFGGVDTPSSYQAGLTYKAEESVAAAQAARHWNVTGSVVPAPGGARVTIDARDGDGNPVGGATVTAHLAHPIDERRDVPVVVNQVGAGLYEGDAVVEPGQWILDFDISKGGERLFRSRNRVLVQ
jgi:nitrogen fixation protein FixH